MRTIAEVTGRPLSMTVQQPDWVPDRWREMQAWVSECVAAGLPLKTQVAARPIGLLQGLTASVNRSSPARATARWPICRWRNWSTRCATRSAGSGSSSSTRKSLAGRRA